MQTDADREMYNTEKNQTLSETTKRFKVEILQNRWNVVVFLNQTEVSICCVFYLIVWQMVPASGYIDSMQKKKNTIHADTQEKKKCWNDAVQQKAQTESKQKTEETKTNVAILKMENVWVRNSCESAGCKQST